MEPDTDALVKRIDYILDPAASAAERMQRRSHLTNHDLRRLQSQAAEIAALRVRLGRIQRLAERCASLPDADGLRRAYRDIDVMSRLSPKDTDR